MVGADHSEVEARFARVRRKLDEGGYLESFGLDSLRLVEHLFEDLLKTTESLQKTLVEYSQYKKVAAELESGVAPFKEENIRLHKENSHLRLGIAKALENAEDKARDPNLRLRELNAENNDLKLLVSQFAERIKRAEAESLEKTKRIIKLQEKELGPSVVVRSDTVKRPPSMEVDGFVTDACPQCIRLRNYVEYGKNVEKNPKAVDYMKLADSRIEALQLQLRSFKNLEKEHLSLIASLKNRVGTRDSEIDKLRDLIKVRPGRDNKANAALTSHDTANLDLNTELKSVEMQLTVLQRRNIELEDKLKKSILQEHQDFMMGKSTGDFARLYLEKELDKFPSHDKMTLLEKLYHLERQLSHCCKEKAMLTKQIEDCKLNHKMLDESSRKSAGPTTLAHGHGKLQTIRPLHGILRTSSSSTHRLRSSKPKKISKGVRVNANGESQVKAAIMQTGGSKIRHITGYDTGSSVSDGSDSEHVSIENEENNVYYDNEHLASEDFEDNQDELQLQTNHVPSNNRYLSRKPAKFSKDQREKASYDKDIDSMIQRDLNSNGMKTSEDVTKINVTQHPSKKIGRHYESCSPVLTEYSNSDVDFNGNISDNCDGNVETQKEMCTGLDVKTAWQQLRGTEDQSQAFSSKGGTRVTSKSQAKNMALNVDKYLSSKKNVSSTRPSDIRSRAIKHGQPTGISKQPVPSKPRTDKRIIVNSASQQKQSARVQVASESNSRTRNNDLVEDEQDHPFEGEFDDEPVNAIRVEQEEGGKKIRNVSLGKKPANRESVKTKTQAPERSAGVRNQKKGVVTSKLKPKPDAKNGTHLTATKPHQVLINKNNQDTDSMSSAEENVLEESATGYYDEEEDDQDAFCNNGRIDSIILRPSIFKNKNGSKAAMLGKAVKGLKPPHSQYARDSQSMHSMKVNDEEKKGYKNATRSSSSTTAQLFSTASKGESKKDRNTRKTVNEKSKGILAIQQPSLLSISEFEREHSEDESFMEFNQETNKVGGNSDKSKSSSLARPVNPTSQSAVGSEEHRPYHTSVTTAEDQTYPMTAGAAQDHMLPQNQNYADSRRGFVEREYSRGGDDDAATSFGENSETSYSRRADNDVKKKGFLPGHVGRGVPELHAGQMGRSATEFSQGQGGRRAKEFSQGQGGRSAAEFSHGQGGRSAAEFSHGQGGRSAAEFSHGQGGRSAAEFSHGQGGRSAAEFSHGQGGRSAAEFSQGQGGRSAAEFSQGQGGRSAAEFSQGQVGRSATEFSQGQGGRSAKEVSQGQGGRSAAEFSQGQGGRSAAEFSQGQGERSAAEFSQGQMGRRGKEFPPGHVGRSATEFPPGHLGQSSAEYPPGQEGRNFPETKFSENLNRNSQMQSNYNTASNPALRTPHTEGRHNVRSVGVNTEVKTGGSLWAESRNDDSSLENKSLIDKISTLQRKLDEVHADSSRHQLKSFELQGELERTKHMLQVEKQERELAISELKRVRELNNESTARMLMNSAMGSDGSFRRGTTPMELEREIVNLRGALASLDRDKDEMRVELDRKDEKMARLTNDASKYMEEISQLKLRLKNAELQISHTGESAMEQTREVEFLKKQVESNRRDLEKTIRERDDALKELHKISGAHTKGQMERRSVETELEIKSKEAEDLRRQVQRYIDEVRRIEELLLDKEEEMETLIQHYRSLTVENNNLEAQRTDLEREASSIRDSVRDAVGQSISLKTQLASQNALVQSLEEEIQNLTQQISQLENQLSDKSEKVKVLEADVKASKDLIFRLEVQMDKIKLDFSDSESKRKQLEAENAEVNVHIASLEARLQEEVDRQQQLESLVANSREKDFQMERNTLDMSREKTELVDQLTTLQQRSETLNTEVSRYRLKSIELQNELDRTRRQLDTEKRERETALIELRRVREQLNSSSANYLLNAALGTTGSSGSHTGGNISGGNITDGSTQLLTTPSSGSTFRQNLLAGDIMQRGFSRESSPFVSSHGLPDDLKLDAPMATSTSRKEESPSVQPSSDGNKMPGPGNDDDEYEEWDSSK